MGLEVAERLCHFRASRKGSSEDFLWDSFERKIMSLPTQRIDDFEWMTLPSQRSLMRAGSSPERRSASRTTTLPSSVAGAAFTYRCRFRLR
jgi:hypothetical protein